MKSGADGRLRSLHLFMDMAPHNMAVRFYGGELRISVLTTSGQKTFYLLNLPYFLVSQIENYLPWFEEEIKKMATGGRKNEVW